MSGRLTELALSPACSRPKSDRALQRQVLDSKASTLRDTKTKDKADSEVKANLDLRNSSEEIRRRSPIDSGTSPTPQRTALNNRDWFVFVASNRTVAIFIFFYFF
jgi:hypothetical protein